MAKSIYSKKDQIWILMPELQLLSEINKGDFSYLQIFSLFGQGKIIAIFRRDGGKDGDVDRDIDFHKMSLFMGMESRVKILEIFRNRLLQQIPNFKEKEMRNNPERIYDNNHHYRFLADLQGYLNAIKSIDELAKSIDKKMEINYWDKIEKKDEHYSNVLAIRHALQHVEAPFVSITGREIQLIFNFIDRLTNSTLKKELQWLSEPSKQKFHFGMGESEIVFEWLESWSQRHLEDINKTEEIDVIDEKKTSNGSIRFVKITLGEVMKQKSAHDRTKD